MRLAHGTRILIILFAVVVTGLTPLNGHAAPSNDNFYDATAVAGIPFEDDIAVDGATLELFEPQPSCHLSGALGPADAASIWYRYEPSEIGLVRADTIESEPYTILAAYKGNALSDLEEIGCNDGDDLANRHLDLALTVGNTYFFRVSVYSPTATGNIHFSLETAARHVHSIADIRPFSATAEDGVVLRGHVYLPDGEAPFATVLEYSPYWNTQSGQSEGQIVTRPDGSRTMPADQDSLHKYFLEAGFAVALVNVRGTGESGGCVHWGDTVDQADAALVVETLAKQPWSNDNVGMIGISASAWTQYWALAAAPPSLKAVMPASGIIDPWSYITRQGAPLSNAASFIPGRTAQLAVGGSTTTVPDTNAHHICPALADDAGAGINLARSGDRTRWFEARDLRPKVTASDVPTFISHGLIHFSGVIRRTFGGQTAEVSDGGHITQMDDLWDFLKGDKRMIIGQWGHRYPPRADFPAMAVGWFDHYLRGGPQTVVPAVVEYEDDGGSWRTAGRWPPPAEETSLVLSGSSLQTAAAVASHQTFQGLGTPCVGLCPASDVAFDSIGVVLAFTGPRIEACAGDQAIYVSPPLTHDVVLAGNFTVDLTVTSSRADGNLSAYLWHTPGDGRCPDAGVSEIRRAVVSLRHWDDEGGRDFPVGVPTPVTLRSWAFANVVPAGHRLVLSIGADSWGLLPKVRPALTITTGPGAAGILRLPVVGGSLRLAGGASEG